MLDAVSAWARTLGRSCGPSENARGHGEGNLTSLRGGLAGSELIFEANAGPPNIALQRPRCARR
jgi:hypothetical protein